MTTMHEQFKALGNETRLRIMRLLAAQGPLIVDLIAARAGVRASIASNHLKVLMHANLVLRSVDGRFVSYDINAETAGEVARFVAWMLGWDAGSEDSVWGDDPLDDVGHEMTYDL